MTDPFHTPPTLRDLLRAAPVLPVLAIDDPADALPLARALVRGGLRLIEVTLRAPTSLDCIARIAAGVPEAVVGAGAVLNAKDLKRATRAGARFAVCPGFMPKIAEDAEIPLLPGVATATDIMRALDHGFDTLHLFPAAAMGGAGVLRAYAEAFAGVAFCPSGGVGYAEAPVYLALPNVVCVRGSWVAPGKAVADRNWDHVEFLAHEAAGLRRGGLVLPVAAGVTISPS